MSESGGAQPPEDGAVATTDKAPPRVRPDTPGPIQAPSSDYVTLDNPNSLIPNRDVLVGLPREGFIWDYLRWATKQTDAPVAFHLATALSMIGAVAPPGLYLWVTSGPLWPNMYTMCVGSSGSSRKTTAIKLGLRCLRQVNPGIVGVHPGSKEGLIEDLQDQEQQLFPYTEFGRFLATSYGLNNYLGPIRDVFTELYDCTPYGSRKKGHEEILVENPRVNVIGGCAPPFLGKYTEFSDWTGGFMGRFFIVVAEREWTRAKGRPDDELFERITGQLARMYQQQGGPCSQLTKDALARWKHYVMVWNAANEQSAHPMVRANYSRAPDLVGKIALNLSLARGRVPEDGSPWVMHDDEVKVAITLVEHHLRSASHIISNMVGTPYQQNRAILLDFITGRPEGVTKADIAKHMKMPPRQLRELLEGICEEETVVSHKPAGTPRERFFLSRYVGGGFGATDLDDLE